MNSFLNGLSDFLAYFALGSIFAVVVAITASGGPSISESIQVALTTAVISIAIRGKRGAQ
jgi:hypothetical protein